MRHLIREEHHEGPAPGCIGHRLSVWTFYYSDGTMESVRRVECRE